jgi:hypothetical protein
MAYIWQSRIFWIKGETQIRISAEFSDKSNLAKSQDSGQKNSIPVYGQFFRTFQRNAAVIPNTPE